MFKEGKSPKDPFKKEQISIPQFSVKFVCMSSICPVHEIKYRYIPVPLCELKSASWQYPHTLLNY